MLTECSRSSRHGPPQDGTCQDDENTKAHVRAPFGTRSKIKLRLITQRSQVQILPPLPIGPGDLRISGPEVCRDVIRSSRAQPGVTAPFEGRPVRGAGVARCAATTRAMTTFTSSPARSTPTPRASGSAGALPAASPPGDPLALCAYLTERAESGPAMGTLDLACVAIRNIYRMTGTEDPVAADAVRQVRLGLHRIYGGVPRRLARPLALDEVRQIVGGIDRTTTIGVRDTAMILLGYVSACDAWRSSRSRWPTSSTHPPGCCCMSAVQDRSRGPRSGRRGRARPA